MEIIRRRKIDFSRISDEGFFDLVNRTKKKWVLKQCLEHASGKQCMKLAQYAVTDKIAKMFAEKLLSISGAEQCKYLAEYARSDRVRRMFVGKSKEPLEPKYYEQFL